MSPFFPFDAQQKHILLLGLNWLGCLILFHVCWLRVQVFFETVDQLEQRAGWSIPIESYFLEHCLQLSNRQPISNVLQDLQYLRAADHISHWRRALSSSHKVNDSWSKTINFIAQMHDLGGQQLWQLWHRWISKAWLSAGCYWLWMWNSRCSVGAIGSFSF